MVFFFPSNTWQMNTFLKPLDALIPKIPFSFFRRILGPGHLQGSGVVSVGVWEGGGRQLSPLWGKRGRVQPEGLCRPPHPQTITRPPQSALYVCDAARGQSLVGGGGGQGTTRNTPCGHRNPSLQGPREGGRRTPATLTRGRVGRSTADKGWSLGASIKAGLLGTQSEGGHPGMRLGGKRAQKGFQERLQRRLPAVRTAVGRQCLAGTKRWEGRWGRTEVAGRADRCAKEGAVGGCLPA